ncbi:MAG TPA: hypothetical protein ENJ09_02820 [Planctomycetes bacterium]|nr:hypothetical protein [Planctomycetota bacterium]
MDPIPETWPPAPHQEVPLFALPNVWLFPYVILPLQVFEPRYVQMVEDLLDSAGRLVVGTVLEGHEDEMEGNPPVHDIAGLGEIGRHDHMDDGRYQILLLGLKRVRIRETESDRLYRKVTIEPAEEIEPAPHIEAILRQELHKAILERTNEPIALLPQIPLSHLADLLALRMELPHAVRNELFSELDLERRARRALEEHGKTGPS